MCIRDRSFTVPRCELQTTIDAINSIVASLGGRIETSENVSKISVVGIGMAHETGVASRMFGALAREEINLQMITTSEIKISVLIEREQSLKALRSAHSEFKLDQAIAETQTQDYQHESKDKVSAIEVINRLQNICLLYTSPSPRDATLSRMPSSA